MRFSERLGIVPEKQIQISEIDEPLRNRIVNYLSSISEDNARFILDKLGLRQICQRRGSLNIGFGNENLNRLIDYISKCSWNIVYDSIELSYQFLCRDCYECTDNCAALENYENEPCGYYSLKIEMEEKINAILEEEKSGYRIISGEISPITNEEEISSLVESLDTPFESVNTHMIKALQFYSNRVNPDYENSIKESICAVEAMCCIITGVTGAKATLGSAIKELEDSGVHIHGAMKSAFSMLYGYTSDENGIRHGGIDFSNAPAVDAKYMLISCSAFINYLKEKYSGLVV